MRRAGIALLILLLWPLSAPEAAERIEGRVVAISDGDTLTVLTAAKQQVKVRLAEIDTPERRQPYGTRAQQALSELAFRKAVRRTGMRSVAGDLEQEPFAPMAMVDGRAARATHATGQFAVRGAPVLPHQDPR